MYLSSVILVFASTFICWYIQYQRGAIRNQASQSLYNLDVEIMILKLVYIYSALKFHLSYRPDKKLLMQNKEKILRYLCIFILFCYILYDEQDKWKL